MERISNYIREVPNEREATAQPTLPAAWPAHGEITIENLTVRYRPELPTVLNGISLSIKAGEHVGIAGRTGQCWKPTTKKN